MVGSVCWHRSSSADRRLDPVLVCDPGDAPALADLCGADAALVVHYGAEPRYAIVDAGALFPWAVGRVEREGARPGRAARAAEAAAAADRARPRRDRGAAEKRTAAARLAGVGTQKRGIVPGAALAKRRKLAAAAAPPPKPEPEPAREPAAPRRKRRAGTLPPSAAAPRRVSPRLAAAEPAVAAAPRRRSPKARLELYRARGTWPDGARVGRGHGQPYLQPAYADLIRSGRKTWEGRANAGWLTKVRADDSITFKVTTRGAERVVARALEVRAFDTFEAMLDHCGLDACLPGCATVAAGAKIYRSFGCFDGRSYADVEAEHGVVAIRVLPLDFYED